MTVSLSFSVTGGTIGRALAAESEEAAEALVELSDDVDHAELTDYIEQWSRYTSDYHRNKLLALADTIKTGVEKGKA